MFIKHYFIVESCNAKRNDDLKKQGKKGKVVLGKTLKDNEKRKYLGVEFPYNYGIINFATF